MIRISKLTLLLTFAMSLTYTPLSAKESVGKVKVKSRVTRRAVGCEAATAAVDLDINNVRARVMNGGDAWWDLVSSARYEIPKVTEAGQVRRHSLFAGALWIGGYQNGNLRLAAMTYRQSGSDFYPGALDTTSASISGEECLRYDRIWEISREEINAFRADRTKTTASITSWPAHGDQSRGQAKNLAPFVNVGGDPYLYEPEEGDYPDVFGDQSLFYIFNDRGNIHNESKADPIGLEVRTQAFAFTTNDEINNMTFYDNVVVNRSSNRLDSTMFGQWVDADLGWYNDDYVGCDVGRSLGICYNGDNVDEGVLGYGDNPPSVGIDFFRGPKDANGNELPMSNFVYYNNDGSTKGNPSEAIHYYQYLTGKWKDGSRIKFEPGGDGFNCPSCPNANFMFPDDPRQPLPAWSERTSNNPVGDRRFVMSAGPFSLLPGAKNNVTVGVVWARATSGGPTGSIDQLKIADDRAQLLYNNQFDLIDGPPSPQVQLQELDNKLILILTDTRRVETYRDSQRNSAGDISFYNFEGYQVYQLATSNVSPDQLNNPDQARLVATVDINNSITSVVNTIFDPVLQNNQSILRARGENRGVRRTFEIVKDEFASGNDRLVNYKFYYYLVVPYAVAENDPSNPEQYLAGRRNVVLTGVPHRIGAEFGGLRLNADYGTGLSITRLQGVGNGKNDMLLTPETEARILNENTVQELTYQAGRGPINVRVIDPLAVEPGNYEVKIVGGVNPSRIRLARQYVTVGDTAHWELTNTSTGNVIRSDFSISIGNEQVLLEKTSTPGVFRSIGLAIDITQDTTLGKPTADLNNGYIDVRAEAMDSSKAWLTSVFDGEGDGLDDNTANPFNWIRSGKFGNLDPALYKPLVHDAAVIAGSLQYADPNEVFENTILAPAALVARSGVSTTGTLTLGPIPTTVNFASTRLADAPNIDVVLTSDKSKWTECVVVEMGEDAALNEGGVAKFSVRAHAGLTKDADANGNPIEDPDPARRGKSWFPGYAINLDNGDRLNIMFGEDSHFPAQNGADMMWNPTKFLVNAGASGTDYTLYYLFGGKHWTWIMNSTSSINQPAGVGALPYDRGERALTILNNVNPAQQYLKNFYWAQTAWVAAPLLRANGPALLSYKDGLIPTETRISARVRRPYAAYNATGVTGDPAILSSSIPYYKFSTEQVSRVLTTDAGKEALQDVNVVPNPYIARSDYETSQLDNRVRLTNLPPKVVISIYTLDGTLVRQLEKDQAFEQSAPYLDWDLKNTNGIPIASGIYLMHVNGFALGTKVVKFFAITRPIDLDTF